jgi:CBS domain-containing protein
MAMRVAQLMSQPVFTCSVNDSLNDAARLMWEHDCGAVPVVDGDGKVVGIVTDRDVCMAAYTQGERLGVLPVVSAMAKQVFCCRPDDSLEKAQAVMGEQQIRRLPVVDAENRPLGMLSLNDLSQEVVRPRSLGNGMQRVFLATVGAVSQPRSSELPVATPLAKPAVASVAKPAVTPVAKPLAELEVTTR